MVVYYIRLHNKSLYWVMIIILDMHAVVVVV